MKKLKNSIILFILFFILIFSSQPKAQTSWPDINSQNKPWTRWWWLGNAVDKSNLTKNLEDLHNAGFGGVEITMIYGVKGNESNEIVFLSPQWMDMLQHTIDEAKRLGMEVDMNTVTGWPFGGPHITHKEAASKAIFQKYAILGGQRLTEQILVKEDAQKEVAELNCLMAYSDKGQKINLTNNVGADGRLDWTAPTGNWQLIALFNGKTGQKVKRSAPGGEGFVMDHFSKKALDVYLSRFTEAFASHETTKPRFFVNDSYEVYHADWTESFLDEFKNRRGYRLEDFFMEFLGSGNDEITARIKSDYRETMSELLIDNFIKPWTKWTHSMGSKSKNQAHGSPANLIDIYGLVDLPECETFGTTSFDIPGLPKDSVNIIQGDADPMMLKFSSSAAHIAGLQYTSAETFTWLGNHFRVSLAQCKPELDQLFLSGINHTFYHGSTYTPKEANWPGWLFYAAVNFVPTDNIWRDINGLSEYTARCQSFLQTGKPDNEILLYWPVYDNWHNPVGTDMPFKIHDLEKWLHPTNFYKTATWLRNNGYDFDYISDRFLASSTVNNGMIKLSGGEYKMLVIPKTNFMPLETLQKIQSMAKNGAKIIFIDALPEDVPGFANLDSKRKQFNKIKKSLKVNTVSSTTKKSKGTSSNIFVLGLNKGMLNAFDLKREQIVETGASFIRRKHDGGHVYFIANQQGNSLEGWIRLGVDAMSAIIFDPLTGQSGKAKIRRGDDGTEVFLQLDYNESVILKTWSNSEIIVDDWNYYQPMGQPISLGKEWQLKFVAGSPEIDSEFILDTLTSWTNLDDDNLKRFAGTGKYALNFTLPVTPADDWLLDLGKVAESARIKINGMDLGIWWSIPFKAPIGKYLKEGENSLEIEVSNLSANRIADYDRKGVDWKIFKDINIVTPYYRPFNASGWDLVDSGLIGPVILTPLKRISE